MAERLDTRARPWVVVGVDGSTDAEHAALWAWDYARTTGGSLELVATHDGRVSYGLPPMQMSYDTVHAAEAAIEKALAALGTDPESVRSSIVLGNAGKVLTDRSATADLVVVGSRGLGGIGRLTLGSTSTHVVHHARCPVVVVPRPEGDRAER